MSGGSWVQSLVWPSFLFNIFNKGKDEDDADDLFSDSHDQDGIDIAEFCPVPDDKEHNNFTENSQLHTSTNAKVAQPGVR